MIKLTLHVFAVMLSLTFWVPLAQAKDPCPPTAVMRLNIIKFNALEGKETNGNKVFGYANQALEHCQDSPMALSVAAELFVIVGESLKISDLDTRLIVFSKAHDTLRLHERSYHASLGSTSGDSTKNFESYERANQALKATMGRLAELKVKGRDHESFSQDFFIPGTGCPYKFPDRLKAEMEGYGAWLQHEGPQQKADEDTYFRYRRVTVNRLEGLRKVCPDFRGNSKLNNDLAEYFEAMAHYIKVSDPSVAAQYSEKAALYENPDSKSLFKP